MCIAFGDAAGVVFIVIDNFINCREFSTRQLREYLHIEYGVFPDVSGWNDILLKQTILVNLCHNVSTAV